jgi:Zn-dependent M28 family amino/carboxypeptidase
VALAALYLTQPILGVARHRAVDGEATRVDAGRLRHHVEELSQRFAPRDPGHPKNLDGAAEYIRGRFAEAGLATSFQEFDVNGRTFRNVVATTGPAAAQAAAAAGGSPAADLVVVGAHYDAAGPAIGADDNASGVAGLLELAPLLEAGRGTARVELVAWCLEEPPFFRTRFMGSRVHAEALRKSGARVRATICLEMIGFFSDADGSQDYPIVGLGLLYPSRADFITVVGCVGQTSLVRSVKRAMAEASDLPVWSINAPRALPGIDFSDHLNYWDAGYDAVMVSDTAFYRNANYHRATDTADRLDYPRMAQVVVGVRAAVAALAK